MCCMKFTFSQFCIQIAITISQKGVGAVPLYMAICMYVSLTKAFGSSRLCGVDFWSCLWGQDCRSLQFCENVPALCPICIGRHLSHILCPLCPDTYSFPKEIPSMQAGHLLSLENLKNFFRVPYLDNKFVSN